MVVPRYFPHMLVLVIAVLFYSHRDDLDYLLIHVLSPKVLSDSCLNTLLDRLETLSVHLHLI